VLHSIRGALRPHIMGYTGQHARAFADVISQFTDDQWLDDRETLKLHKLHQALARLGWAPGERVWSDG